MALPDQGWLILCDVEKPNPNRGPTCHDWEFCWALSFGPGWGQTPRALLSGVSDPGPVGGCGREDGVSGRPVSGSTPGHPHAWAQVCGPLRGTPVTEVGPCSLGTGEGCVGTGQLSALLCSSASDFRGTRVRRLRPSGSTGDLLVASPGCARALGRLRGCAEVTPSLEIEMGPWEPTTCDLHVAWALVLVLPPTRSLPRPLMAPVSLTVGRGDEACAPEPRADSERSRGRAVSPGLAAAICTGPQPQAHHCPGGLMPVWLGRVGAGGICHLRCSMWGLVS